MSKERTVLLRTTSFSVEAREAAVGARPATVASDDDDQRSPALAGNIGAGRAATNAAQVVPSGPSIVCNCPYSSRRC